MVKEKEQNQFYEDNYIGRQKLQVLSVQYVTSATRGLEKQNSNIRLS